MGGETTEMSATTTHVLIEAAHWDAGRRCSAPAARHKLTSEACKRNERGVDPTMLPEAAADRVAELLVDVRRRHASSRRRDRRRARRPRRAHDHHRRRPARADHRHAPSTPTTTVAHLRGRRLRRRRGRATTLTATVPPWRPDLTDPFDLVEEVARIVGYDQVPSVLPPAPGRARADPRRSGCAAGSAAPWPAPGCVEVMSFPFVGDADLDALGLARPTTRARTRCGWPTRCRREEPAITTTLLPGLLKAAARNVGRGASERGALRDRRR